MKTLTITQAAALWARLTGGHRPHRATIRRWILVGCAGQRLKGFRSGSAILTTEEAVRDFFDRMNAGFETPALPALDAAAAEAAAEVDELLARS